MVFDEGLVVPDPEKTLEQGAILPWRRGGKRMVVYYKGMLRGIARHYEQSMEIPFKDLPKDFQRTLLHGSGETEIEFTFSRAGKTSKILRPFEGVIPNLERLYRESESEFTRNRLKAFMSPQFCDACGGQRLKPEILAVTLVGAANPLTPALSPSEGERENRSQRVRETSASESVEGRRTIPPLPGGEGRGEGELHSRLPPAAHRSRA